MRNKAGFTLIEIMVSLVLVGLIASIAGTAVVMGTRGYLFARENDAITQKAQLALGRLSREFIELSNVKAVNDSQPYLIYEVPSRIAGVLAERRAVAKVENAVRMYFDAEATPPFNDTKGATLVDGVQSFSIMYNPSGGVSLWSMGQDIRNLFAVNVQLVLARPDTGGTVSFYSTVSPRNNNNSGGAALPTTSNPPPEYSGKQCFVTTAAYGDANHPVVEVLRQFRDRVLLPTDPGKALVRYYYEAGPSLAAAIEDKPLACLFVRLLVTPVAGFAFLALFYPVLIPVILLLSWGLARLALRALERRSLRWTSRLQGQRGAMLVTLIAAMVVFSALGAVMLGMFGTAALSQASGSSSMKAYYLAESGYRYAASRYIAVDLGSELANEAARDSLLETELHGKTFSLSPGDGGFRIDAYPYYYKVAEFPLSTNQLRTRVTGGFPLEGTSYSNGSWVQVRKKIDGSIQYVQISGVSTHTYAGYKEVRFYTLSGGNWDGTIDVGATVTPVSVPDRTALTATDGDGDGLLDFIPFVANSGAAAFPARNGIFTVTVMESGSPKSRTLSYRELDITNRRLKGIGDPNGLPLTSLTLKDPQTILPPQNFIELTKFIRLESTGTIGTGAAAVSRTVTYYTPIGSTTAEQASKTKFHDEMRDLTNWQRGDHIGRIGTSTPGTSYGTTLKVDSSQVLNQAPGANCLKFMEFQVGLNWSGAGIPLQQEWLRAGNYLSYDLQMKAFYTWIYPSPKHALGLTFRLDEDGNALGFTYARGVPGYTGGCDNDGIPHGWLGTIPGYTNYTPVLLFWMKEYTKKESGIEAVPSPCSATSPTTIGELPRCDRVTKAIFSNRNDWQNGERVRFTNTGGAFPPPIVAGKDYYIRAILYNSNMYLYLFSNETGALNFDPDWPGLVNITDYGLGSTTIIVQDPTFTKLAHQVLTPGNEYYKLITSYYLTGFATFMARVNEAPSVSFVNGGGAAGREILSGETVYQTSNNLAGGTVNAVYKAMRSPYYRAAKSGGQRLWSSGTEQGVLLLERIAGESLSDPSTAPFTAGSKIFVGEHPGGTDAGTVGVPGGASDVVFRKRDNWLMFYVGDQSGNPPADINPFNNYRGSILRNSVLWPPDNPENTAIRTDNFTLLRFSDYVKADLTCMVNGVARTGIYCLTGFYSKDNTGSAGDVLRFASPDGNMFYSPQSGTEFPAGRAEFGLHTYGAEGQFTEFDDFALQFGPGPGPSRKGFLMPIQQ